MSLSKHIISKYNLYVSNNNAGNVFMLVTIIQEMSLSVSTTSMLVTIIFHLNLHVSWTCIYAPCKLVGH